MQKAVAKTQPVTSVGRTPWFMIDVMQELTLVHIFGGSVAVVGGYVALFARKGAPLHRRAGTLFVYAMLVMGFTASVMAMAIGRESQVSAGLIIAYFLITALNTVREPTAMGRRLDVVLMAIAFGLGITGIALSTHALLLGITVVDGAPIAVGLVLRILLLMAALGDLRVLRSGPLRGGKRLYRHLWRMCYAFFIATGSFFLGQADEIPAALRWWPGLFVLAFIPLLAIAYWSWRLRPRRRERALSAMTIARAHLPVTLEAVK